MSKIKVIIKGMLLNNYKIKLKITLLQISNIMVNNRN